MTYCKNCDSELCTDQIEAGLYELGKCHDCSTPEELQEISDCKDFWESDRFKQLQNLQRISEGHGSHEHKYAHEQMVKLAKERNVFHLIKDMEIY